MKTYITGDPHYNHEGILGFTDRGYPTLVDHDEGLLDWTNRTVQENDRLIVVGDFAWSAEEVFRKRIRCRNVHLIIGNHDRPRAGKLFHTVEDVTLIKLQGHQVWLSHYAHAYWPASHYGSLHLYGHTHALREEFLDRVFPGRRSMDAGVDNAMRLLGEPRPFSEDEVIEILSKRPGHDSVEWYREQDRIRKCK